MELLSHTLNTGLDRSLGSSARMLQLLDKVMAEESIPAEQKDEIIRLVAASYLVGLMAPVAQMDAFSQKLDMLLLETKYRTREELLQELKKNSTLEQAIDDIQIRNKQMAEELAKLREMAKTVELTKEDVSQLKEQTAGVPYFIDQNAKETRKDLQRINALKISLNLNEMELQILKFHDRGWTQSRIAAYLKVNVRTVQRLLPPLKKNTNSITTHRLSPGTIGRKFPKNDGVIRHTVL